VAKEISKTTEVGVSKKIKKIFTESGFESPTVNRTRGGPPRERGKKSAKTSRPLTKLAGEGGERCTRGDGGQNSR